MGARLAENPVFARRGGAQIHRVPNRPGPSTRHLVLLDRRGGTIVDHHHVEAVPDGLPIQCVERGRELQGAVIATDDDGQIRTLGGHDVRDAREMDVRDRYPPTKPTLLEVSWRS